jgi:large subunit ribosomal protein L19
MNKVDLINKKQLKKDLPDFKQGDTIQVHIKVKEDDKERIQVFEGIVLGVKGKGLAKSFTIRKISYGVGGLFLYILQTLKRLKFLRKAKLKEQNFFI